MPAAGLIDQTDERTDPELDDERGRYYGVTGFGTRVLDVETERLQRLVATAESKRSAGGPPSGQAVGRPVRQGLSSDRRRSTSLGEGSPSLHGSPTSTRS